MPFVPDRPTSFVPDKTPTSFVPDKEQQKGFIGGLIERPEKFVPVLGGVIQTAKTVQLIDAASRLESGFDYSKPIKPEQLAVGAQGIRPAIYTTREKDLELLANWAEQHRQQYTWGGRVGQIVGEIPSFAIEVGLTSGIFTSGKKITKEVVEKALKDYAGKKATAVAAGIAGYGVGAVAQGTAMPQRYLKTFV